LAFVLTKYLLGRGVDPEASNNFGIEKWHFLTGLDTPDIPTTDERCFYRKYF
jgi:hypothetical protein